jgi:hypothetical protein
MEKLRVIVDIEPTEDGRTNIQVLQNKEQDLSSEDLAHILAGGLALCIRSCEDDGKVMGDIMNYLQREFIDNDFQVGKYGTGG